ncbi:hypothetical protein FJ250_03625 [bacterium]|nr:hypothetical protein [bacterium]
MRMLKIAAAMMTVYALTVLSTPAVGAETFVTEVMRGYFVTAPNGNRLWVEVVQPRPDLYPGRRFPAVVCVPGGLGAGENGHKGFAATGIIEFHFNAEGRGVLHPSEGVEDHNGFLHQDDLRAVILFAHNAPNGLPAQLGVLTSSYGITMGAGCLGRYPDLPVKYLIDGEGPDESYVTSFEPWALDAVPTNNREVGAYNMFGHWSTTRDPSPANLAWWQEREALRYIGQVRCAYLRVQAQWDHAQPPNAQWPGFDYPPLWYPCKHAVDMVNAATLGDAPWTRLNGAAIGNPIGGTYSREAPPVYYAGAYVRDTDLVLVQEMIALDLGTTGVGEPPRAGPVLAVTPNPFNPATRLAWGQEQPGAVDLAVFDLRGRRLRSLAAGWQGAGSHAVSWDGRDDAGRALPSGVYVARLSVGPASSTVKVILAK